MTNDQERICKFVEEIRAAQCKLDVANENYERALRLGDSCHDSVKSAEMELTKLWAGFRDSITLQTTTPTTKGREFI